MKYSQEKPVSSRKKQAPEQIDERTTSLIHSPNLKYQLLTNGGGSLVRQLRKDQFNQIMNLLNSNSKKLYDGMTEKIMNKILICVGAPGTGKTSVIKQAIAEYQNECKSRKSKKQCSVYSVSSIRVLFFNGNSLMKLEQLTKQISMQNTDESQLRLLSKIIKIEKSSENCVLNVIYIEQFQRIVESNNEDSLKQFMQLFDNRKSKQNEDKKKKALQQYVLIGTSNNVNIEQMMLKKMGVSYRLKIMVFKPYPMQQKIKIVNQRIDQIKQRIGIELKIPQKLIKFIIMKLNQNKKDDTRSLIEVIKQILLVSQSNQSVIDSIDRGQTAVFDVSLEMLQQHQKIRGMLMNSKVDLIEKLNFKQHLVLALIYREFKTNQSIQMLYTQLSQQFNKAQRQMGLQYSLEAKTMVEELQGYGMVQMRNKSLTKTVTKNDKLSCKASIILNVSLNDIERALSKVPLFSKYFS